MSLVLGLHIQQTMSSILLNWLVDRKPGQLMIIHFTDIQIRVQGGPKTVPHYYLCDNFRKCTPILVSFSLLEQENLVKHTLLLISTLHVWFIDVNGPQAMLCNSKLNTHIQAILQCSTHSQSFFPTHSIWFIITTRDHPTCWSYYQWNIVIFFHLVIIALFSNFTMLNFIYDRHDRHKEC